jgi:hypothetical protein
MLLVGGLRKTRICKINLSQKANLKINTRRYLLQRIDLKMQRAKYLMRKDHNI